VGLKPDEDLAAHIATTLSLTLDTDVIAAQPDEQDSTIPHQAIFVFPVAGPEPQDHFAPTTTSIMPGNLQVRVRSGVNEHTTGLALARSVRDAIHHAAIAAYINVRILSVEPSPLGKDRHGRSSWSIPVEMLFDE
jgi:hypothetical protein